jgi:calmodulin
MSSKSRKTGIVPRRDVTSANDKVKKNAKGGVLVTPEEMKLAFDFLDTDKSGKISLANLKKRLSVFFPNMTAKEYRFLMNNKREMTLQDLQELLTDNEVTGFDPVAEAFKVSIIHSFAASGRL